MVVLKVGLGLPSPHSAVETAQGQRGGRIISMLYGQPREVELDDEAQIKFSSQFWDEHLSWWTWRRFVRFRVDNIGSVSASVSWKIEANGADKTFELDVKPNDTESHDWEIKTKRRQWELAWVAAKTPNKSHYKELHNWFLRTTRPGWRESLYNFLLSFLVVLVIVILFGSVLGWILIERKYG